MDYSRALLPLLGSAGALVGIMLLLAVGIENLKRQGSKGHQSLSTKNGLRFNRRALFNRSEEVFFRLLIESFPRYHVLAKVKLDDLIEVADTHPEHERFAGRNSIKSRHIDFALYDWAARRIVAVIELDGSSHHSPRAMDADRLKDEVFASAGIPLVRVPVSREYNTDWLREAIDSRIAAA